MMDYKDRIMDEILHSIASMLHTIYNKSAPLLSGFFSSIIGYFIPVRDVVHLLLILFVVDVIFGYWAAKKLRGERFKVKIIWDSTIPRILTSIVIILGVFMWDNVYNQEMFVGHKIIGWFISGMLLFSIVENGFQITKWSVFGDLLRFIKSKIKEKTGIEIFKSKVKE
jgi:phage-related holin